MPFAFASYFAPAMLLQAITDYRNNFRPLAKRAKPCVIIGAPERVREGLTALAQAIAADELRFVCDFLDPAFRLRSLDIAASVFIAVR